MVRVVRPASWVKTDIYGDTSHVALGPQAAVGSKFGCFLRTLVTPAPINDWAMISLREALISVDDC